MSKLEPTRTYSNPTATDVILDTWIPFRRIWHDGDKTIIEFYYVSESTGKVVGK